MFQKYIAVIKNEDEGITPALLKINKSQGKTRPEGKKINYKAT